MQSSIDTLTKPHWLNKKINLKQCDEIKLLLKGFELHTVCQQALCPNISECFAKKVATFLILGNVCTRKCSFCAIRKGTPALIDEDEPYRLAGAVAKLKLSHVVITSVTRDDLEDGGAGAFAKTIEAIRSIKADTIIEVLVPDFGGSVESIQKIIAIQPDIFAHNIETVARLYPVVRKGADYRRSLGVLATAKKLFSFASPMLNNGTGFGEYSTKHLPSPRLRRIVLRSFSEGGHIPSPTLHMRSRINKDIFIKSGIMLGLGESAQEAWDVISDLRAQGCDFLSIGQYLAPSSCHYPVKEYLRPEQFAWYRKEALSLGFRSVESGPYVRSSYIASEYMKSVILNANKR